MFTMVTRMRDPLKEGMTAAAAVLFGVLLAELIILAIRWAAGDY